MFIDYKTENYRNSDNGFGGNFPITNMSPLSKFNEVSRRPLSKSVPRNPRADNHEHSIAMLFYYYYYYIILLLCILRKMVITAGHFSSASMCIIY